MIDVNALIESDGLYQSILPSGERLVWRLLTMREYQVFSTLRASESYPLYVLYDLVFSHCYVGNPDLINGNLPAGYFIGLGELILWLSGDSLVSNERDQIEIARENYAANSVVETMKRIVYIAFPSYTPDDLDKWSYQQLLKKFTIAEAVLVNKEAGYQPIDVKKILTPDQAKKQKQLDFSRENKELNQSIGDQRHVLEMSPEALALKQRRFQKSEASRENKRKLSEQSAAKLEKQLRR